MKFTKMHGAGNDFIVVDCLQRAPEEPALPDLALRACDRHFGIGADGLVFVLPSDVADFRMRIINSDGSEAEHCGNAVRCIAKYVYERGLARGTTITLETIGRVNRLQANVQAGKVPSVRVDMGEPVFARRLIPMTGPEASEVIEEAIPLNGRSLRVTCVSMGNPHAVTFVEEDPAGIPLEKVGPQVEHHPVFPRRTNTEFVQVLARNELKMRVWERGAGETLACGTGACATLVAAARTGRADRKATVHLLGGDLFIEWGEDNHVYMTGPAVEVFTGEYPEGE